MNKGKSEVPFGARIRLDRSVRIYIRCSRKKIIIKRAAKGVFEEKKACQERSRTWSWFIAIATSLFVDVETMV
jgi:hypothetical protein